MNHVRIRLNIFRIRIAAYSNSFSIFNKEKRKIHSTPCESFGSLNPQCVLSYVTDFWSLLAFILYWIQIHIQERPTCRHTEWEHVVKQKLQRAFFLDKKNSFLSFICFCFTLWFCHTDFFFHHFFLLHTRIWILMSRIIGTFSVCLFRRF